MVVAVLVFAALSAALLAAIPARARADDHVSIRGAYYREASTRVIQPVVEIAKNLPDGYDVSAHYLLDAITSASGAAGGVGDTIFTELRNEVALGVGKTFDRTRITASYRYSAESDYWSHGFLASITRRFWGDTATLSLYLGRGFDAVSARNRTPACLEKLPIGTTSCPLEVYTGGLSYTQVLTPRLLVQLSYDLTYLDGFQASIYRSVPNFGYEVVPDQRTRHALTGHVAYYIPRTGTGLQGHARIYHDSWEVNSLMLEGRVYQMLARDLEVRLSYRQYFQSAADFWCDLAANSNCYPITATDYTSDPKLTPMHTEMPEVQLAWDAVRLRGVPFFGWFSTGTFEVSYARYFQSTSFGNANLLQLGYTMPY